MTYRPASLARCTAALILGAAVAMPASAQQLPAGPPSKLRDLTTDRPDTTESPFTVDAGHFQFETTLFGYAISPADPAGVRERSFEFGTTDIRIGLTRSIEFNVIVRPFGITAPGGGAPRSNGIGEIDLRAKWNLKGNDGGPLAVGILPYVSIPTDRNNGVSSRYAAFGVLIPVSIELGGPFSLGLNAGANARREDGDARYRAYGVATASLAVEWSDRIGSYFEFAGEAGGGRPASISLNTGLTWKANDNLQFDAGTQFGVNGDTPRFGPFVGVSFRL